MSRLEKLPKWAQDEISRLERDLAYWQERASIGPDESNTFAHPYSEFPTPLGMDAQIEFRSRGPGPGKKLRVMLDSHGDLDVNGDDSIMIFPYSGNGVKIRLGRRL